MGESFSKKDQKNKKAKAKEAKAQKMRDRKLNNDKGKGLEDMLAYVDENGNLTSVPPGQKTDSISAEELAAMASVPSRPAEDPTRTGVITFFNSGKGFGFITDDSSKDSVFFHMNDLSHPVKERDRVSFLRERSPRGYNARNVTKI